MKKILDKFGIHDFKSFKALVLQFIKFGMVGVSNTVVHLSVYYALIYIGVLYIIANVIAFILSALNSFFWNRNFVFKKTSEKKGPQFLRVIIGNGLILLFSTSMLYFWVDILGISEYIAPLLNMFVTVPTSFILNKFWVYRDTKKPGID